MNLEGRKIDFIQEFLKLQSKEAVYRLEKLLRKEKQSSNEQEFRRLTQGELNKRIDQSEFVFQNNKFKSTVELLEKYNNIS